MEVNNCFFCKSKIDVINRNIERINCDEYRCVAKCGNYIIDNDSNVREFYNLLTEDRKEKILKKLEETKENRKYIEVAPNDVFDVDIAKIEENMKNAIITIDLLKRWLD